MSAAWPDARFVARFIKLRKQSTRALIIITAATSFTFFGSVAISKNEPYWIAAGKAQAKRDLDTILRARRQLVAATWSDKTVRALTLSKAHDLGAFFSIASQEPNSEGIVEIGAEQLAARAPILNNPILNNPSGNDNSKTGEASTFESITIPSLLKWTLSPDASTPSVADIKACHQQAEKAKSVIPEAEAAVVEAVKATLGTLLPKNADPLIKPFAKALINSTAKTSLAKVIPKYVSDLRTAALWLQLAAGPTDSPSHHEPSTPVWQWELRSSSLPAKLPPEVAMVQIVLGFGRQVKERESKAAIEKSGSANKSHDADTEQRDRVLEPEPLIEPRPVEVPPL